MTHSDSFQLASDFINYTHSSVFLTGKAGTGKTTFLKHCKENGVKNTAVIAPTGVAAMNAGGTTIHSFFQLPFNPFIPAAKGFGDENGANDKNSLMSRLRLTNDRREVMQKLELLIIDEISMVRCDVLDAIDTVLRHVRRQHAKPFGGIQVLLIGDMYQLPPVVKDEEWQILAPYYKSPYFFNSLVMEMSPPVYMELDKIYRQNDPLFVNVLNQVRNNEMDEQGFNLLHSRYLPQFNPAKTENYITLTTHNNKAEAINFKEINELDGALVNFNARIEGEFYEKSYPADVQLKLKPGAQVMFIKNDTEKVRRYFNGKIGIVKKIEDDKIQVMCDGDPVTIEVKKEKWKNIRYVVDKASNQLEENEIGSFTQFPLRLAWAITIHKSQGLTFEKAIIDAGDAFAPGQVYVALSRCTNLEGMILHSRIQNGSLHSDHRITAFAKNQQTSLTQLRLLEEAKHRFQQEEIKALFDFSEELFNAKSIQSFVATHTSSFNAAAHVYMHDLLNLVAGIDATATKFYPQLNQLLDQPQLPEQNEALLQRLVAAANHFLPLLENIKLVIQQSPAETDSKLIGQDFNKILLLLFNSIVLKIHGLTGCKMGFTVKNYLAHKRAFVKPTMIANAYAGKSSNVKTESPHPELYQLLRNKRDALCQEKKSPVYLIAGTNSLEEMARFLPQTYDDLTRISGFGAVKTKLYGEAFLTIIGEYCELHNLQCNIEAKPIKANRKEKKEDTATSTKTASFNLYKAGMSLAEIALERNLSVGTIEGHLTYFVATGAIDISSIISRKKQELIEAAIEKFGKASSKTLKENLPDEISFGEIRMMIALKEETS